MRKTVALVAGTFVLGLSLNTFAQDKGDKDEARIQGSGNVITKDVAIQPFDQLQASGIFNVVLTQGAKESVKIKADDNLQQLFEVKNEGSKLIVSMKKDSHFNTENKMTVYITFKNLKSMELKMVGNVTSEGNLSFSNLSLDNSSVGSVDLALNASKLDIKNKSVGSLKLKGKADNAVIKSNSVGSIRASEFVVQTMDIDNDGVGGAEVNAAKELKVKESFLGRVKNAGSATAKRINKVVI